MCVCVCASRVCVACVCVSVCQLRLNLNLNHWWRRDCVCCDRLLISLSMYWVLFFKVQDAVFTLLPPDSTLVNTTDYEVFDAMLIACWVGMLIRVSVFTLRLCPTLALSRSRPRLLAWLTRYVTARCPSARGGAVHADAH